MTFSSTPGRRLRHAFACVAAFAALTACGGGTSQQEPFIAQRMFAFGDETSLLTSSGQSYSVNGITAVDNGTGATVDRPDCTALPIWVQSMASVYGFVFAECNPSNIEPKARMLAAFGAKTEDLKVQIDVQISSGGFRDRDLATVLAGANDIIELYEQFPGRTEADLAGELRGRGKRLAEQVNRLVDFGVKVIVATVPDMGVTPYAIKQRTEFGDTDRAALLTRLTTAFNEQLGVNIVLDGRFVGLVQADLRTQAMSRSPASFGLANVTEAVCLPASLPPACSTATLVDGGSAQAWMWSDDRHLAFSGQQQLATLAVDRANRNPF